MSLFTTSVNAVVFAKVAGQTLGFIERCRYAAAQLRKLNETFQTEKFSHQFAKVFIQRHPNYVGIEVNHNIVNHTRKPHSHLWHSKEFEITVVDGNDVKFVADSLIEGQPYDHVYQPGIPYELKSTVKVSYTFKPLRTKAGGGMMPIYCAVGNYTTISTD